MLNPAQDRKQATLMIAIGVMTLIGGYALIFANIGLGKLPAIVGPYLIVLGIVRRFQARQA